MGGIGAAHLGENVSCLCYPLKVLPRSPPGSGLAPAGPPPRDMGAGVPSSGKLTGSSRGRGCSTVTPAGTGQPLLEGQSSKIPGGAQEPVPLRGGEPRPPQRGSRSKLSGNLGDCAAERSLPCVRRVVPTSSYQLPAIPGRLSTHAGCVFRVGFPRGRPAGWYTCLLHGAGGRPSVCPPLLVAPSRRCAHLRVFGNAAGLYVPRPPFTAQECGALTAGVHGTQDSRASGSAHTQGRGLDCQSHRGGQCHALSSVWSARQQAAETDTERQ